MLKRLIKNKKAQNTAEYAILISLVVAGIIAMQTYAQRALQARVRDASLYLASQGSPTGYSTQQYEPYYLESDYNVDKYDSTTRELGEGGTDERTVDSNRLRQSGGYQVSTYDNSMSGIVDGI